ncbi:rhodanese family protein [Aestuariivirga litoralis]|uniref:rhodanese family protein n=1 Tax=Aestuariivirga litoralis TaxID=2650924 RepID=UPI0018C695FD|nr:rhodanese family protein [Aestuariivirga litoralis]MBG1233303.1 DUF2892 domain-containing protein [Aestuariivirga litoralis]
MNMKNLTAQEVRAQMDGGAMLIDIREQDEFARESIPGASNVSLARLCDEKSGLTSTPVIFHCKSGTRTRMNAELLARATGGSFAVLDGGIEAWKSAGFATVINRRKPLEMMRQVQIAAGSLVALGAGLGFVANPGFYALSAAVGLGLVFAGMSGTCMMARLLHLAPWNRV